MPEVSATPKIEDRRCRQESLGPVLVGQEQPEQPEQARALRHEGEQGGLIARQPAVEGPLAPSFERIEQPQRHHLAGIEQPLGGNGTSLIASSTRTNKAMIHSSVDMGCSSN